MTACTRKQRRCRTVATLDADGTSESSGPWASLPGDILLLVARRVLAGDFLDYVRLRAICSDWRSGTVSPRCRGIFDRRFHPRRWMLLPEGHGLHPGHRKLRGYVRFLNLDTGALVRIHLPLFRNHCALDSVDSLLLLQRDEDTAVRLLHPFTGDIAELPPLATLLTQMGDLNSQPEPGKWFFIRFGICASVDVSCSETTGAVVSAMLLFQRQSSAAFATSLDKQWTMTSWKVPCHVSRLSFQGKIYLVHNPSLGPIRPQGSQILQMDPPPAGGSSGGLISISQSQPLLPPKVMATCPVAADLPYRFYLVECGSEILVVGSTNSACSHVVVYKLADLVLGRLIPLKSIGGCALFMKERALSVPSKAFPTAMADTVVYIDPDDCSYKQYQLSTGTWSPPADECNLDGIDPGPRTIIHHIITCCVHSAWNKGLVYSKKELDKNGWMMWKVKRKFRHWS